MAQVYTEQTTLPDGHGSEDIDEPRDQMYVRKDSLNTPVSLKLSQL